MHNCKIEGCKKKYHAKGFCLYHYKENLRKDLPPLDHSIRYKNDGMICRVEGCLSSAHNLGLCVKHYFRWLYHRDVNYRGKIPSGKDNWNWNGGVSDYPNHWAMKKARLIKLEQTKGKCEKCGKKGKHLHHKDNSKDNHSLSNFEFLCLKCHYKNHLREKKNYPKKEKTSKFIRLYGNTIKGLGIQFNLPMSKIYLLHQIGILSQKLKLP